MQSVFDRQDTPDKTLDWAPVGSGTDWIAQIFPFHRSASAKLRALVSEFPTAVHAVGVMQDTPHRKLKRAPAGLVIDWATHLRPVHPSARTPVPVLPTAEQLTAEAQDTASSTLCLVGLGVDWIFQAALDALVGTPVNRLATIAVITAMAKRFMPLPQTTLVAEDGYRSPINMTWFVSDKRARFDDRTRQ